MDYDELKMRAKMTWLSPEVLQDFLLHWKKQDAVCLPDLQVPDGTRIDAIHFDFGMNAFAIRLVNPEWPRTASGRMLEVIDPMVQKVDTEKALDALELQKEKETTKLLSERIIQLETELRGVSDGKP
jgi:hypothetical protein